MTGVDRKALARLGAKARLAELAAERDAILTLFPELVQTSGPPAASGASARVQPGTAKASKRRRMTAEQRKAVSARMKRYWQQRKNAL